MERNTASKHANESENHIYLSEKQPNLDKGINAASTTSSESDSLIQNSIKIEGGDEKLTLLPEKRNFLRFYFLQIILAIPFFIGIMCYMISLEPCLKDYDTCLSELDKAKISRLLTISCISVISLSFKYFLIFHFEVSYKFFRLSLITCVLAYLTLIHDTGNSFKSHGAYNRLFIYIGVPVVYGGFYLTLVLYRCYCKYGKAIPLATLSVVLIFIFYMRSKYNSSCDYWDKGFKDSVIDNSVSCKLEKPKICNEIIFDSVFDTVFYLNDDCKKRRNDDPEILKEYTKLEKLTKVAYPRVEKWDLTNVCNYYYFRDNVLKEVFNLDDPDIPQSKKKSNEVYVDFTLGATPQVKIELKKNEALVKKREKTFKENVKKNKVMFKNILFFFVDSMSRNHFKRKLPKVYEWIEKFFIPNSEKNNNNKNQNNYTHESFQFLKYHGVGTWTNINLQPFFFGVPYDASEGIYALNYFKNRGYITGSTENTCSREFVGLYSGEMSWLVWDSYDHDFTSFFCDPNFYSKEKVYSMTDGPYCYRRKCLYGRQTYEYSVEYANQFFNAYKDQGKMFRLGNIDAHEGTGESVKYVEDDMMKFLNDFEKNGHLNDTMIIFFSDHGYTMPGIHQILQSEDHVKELLLPYVYFLIPKNTKNFEKIRENLKHNENMFMTPYDMHNTLLGMLDVDKKYLNHLGTDVIKNKLKGNEGCKKFKIKDEWCKCRHDDKSLN